MANNQDKLDDPVSTDSESLADDDGDRFATPTGGSISGDRDQSIIGETRAPQAGHTYVIQSVKCGRMLTLVEGQVVLARYDTFGCMYWACVEKPNNNKNGDWFGFRNVASGRFLRHAGGIQSGLRCSNDKLETWERLSIRPRRDEDGTAALVGQTILIEHWGSWKPLGITMYHGEEVLDRLTNDDDEVLAWVFLDAHELESKPR